MATTKAPKQIRKPNIKQTLPQQTTFVVVNSDELDNIIISNDIEQPITITKPKPKIQKKTNTVLGNQDTIKMQTPTISEIVKTKTDTVADVVADVVEDTVEDVVEDVIEDINKTIKPLKIIKPITDTIDTQEILLELDKDNKDNKDKNKIKNKHPVKKNNVLSTELFNDEELDYRTILMNYDFTKNITKPKITKYEKALLVGKRAKQLEEGANPNVKVLAGQSMIDVAEEELRQRLMPFMIKRPIGNLYEYWRLKDMEVNMD